MLIVYILLGNVARTFFQNFAKSSEITGVDSELIRKFGIILMSISSGRELSERFGEYTWETAKLYISKYNWYRMPISVHKILIHGAEAARHMILPVIIMINLLYNYTLFALYIFTTILCA